MSRKTPSFHQLVQYLDQEGKTKKNNVPFCHNLLSAPKDTPRIIQEFYENAAHVPKRKNGVYCYHEVLSASSDDQEHVEPAMLIDLAAEYIRLRAPNSLVYGTVHTDTAHPHIHLIISANEIGSSKKIRVSQSKFRTIKRKLEKYQVEKYPQLLHSLAQSQPKKRDKEDVSSERIPSPRERDSNEARTSLLNCLQESSSHHEFAKKLVETDFEITPLLRSPGIRNKKTGLKYKLQTLGIAKAWKAAHTKWDDQFRRLKIYHRIAKRRIQNRVKIKLNRTLALTRIRR